MADNKMTDDEYVKSGGGKCKRCLSEDIDGGGVNIDGKYATQRVSCNECGHEWGDVYTLTSTHDD